MNVGAGHQGSEVGVRGWAGRGGQNGCWIQNSGGTSESSFPKLPASPPQLSALIDLTLCESKPQVGTVWATGHISFLESSGLFLPRQLQEGLKVQHVCSRLTLKMLIIYGCRMLL